MRYYNCSYSHFNCFVEVVCTFKHLETGVASSLRFIFYAPLQVDNFDRFLFCAGNVEYALPFILELQASTMNVHMCSYGIEGFESIVICDIRETVNML